MHLIYNHGFYKIFADGDDLLVSTEQGIYLIKEPCLKTFTMNIRQDVIETTTWGGSMPIFGAGLKHLELDLSFVGGVAEFWPDKDPGAYLLQKYSVRELLKGVNVKLNKR